MKSYIGENISSLRKQIGDACGRAGRDPSEIILVAVSKTVGTAGIEEAIKFGCRDFGENRVADFMEKYEYFNGRVAFHMIGHLQTNKVKNIIGRAKLIHSVDSTRLLEEIEKRAAAIGVVQDILIQVDVAGEESKFGASEKEMMEMIEQNEGNSHVRIRGLMTMAPVADDPDEVRWVFRKLRDVFIDTRRKTFYNTVMDYTSMGMSNDFAVAIEEGADIIRVGSLIFHENTKDEITI
ncbi:MAG: YggS family pyridoxal phosphate-dependent enzyme [Clostridia bacterium]|nr:YggS family pyridoxal phosphate-dependent enzyme [Clostridia bacterium]